MYDTVIIGAGPAGLSAALYAGRFRMNAMVIEKLSCGGQIVLSETIENYPGFPGGITTAELIGRFQKQVEEVGVHFEYAEVLAIKESGLGVYEVVSEEKTYQTRTVIIASGAQAKRLGVSGEEKFTGRGVSYCATCDGPLFRNKAVVVVGGGDRAIEEALFLSRYASRVTVIHRRKELRASNILQEKARADSKIEFVLGNIVEEIYGVSAVESVKVKDILTGSAQSVKCQGVFIFVGIIPNIGMLRNFLEIDGLGFIITASDAATNRKGIFACGDCCKKSLYQVVSACGEGAIAADSAHKYLLNQ